MGEKVLLPNGNTDNIIDIIKTSCGNTAYHITQYTIVIPEKWLIKIDKKEG